MRHCVVGRSLSPTGRPFIDNGAIETDTDAVLYLLEGAGVALIPGTVYGLSPYFRMSIATGIEIIEEGCRRIAKAVTELR